MVIVILMFHRIDMYKYVNHFSLCHIAATFHGEISRDDENDEEEEYDTDCENSGKSYIILSNHRSVFIDVSQS